MANAEITNRIKLFKSDLRNEKYSSERIVSKHITFGTPYIFANNNESYYDFKEEIADFYNIRPSCVNMAGSAKLGFSLKSGTNLFRHITDESDIDAVVIDEYLFDNYWSKLLDYYSKNAISYTEEEKHKLFELRKYFFKGWLRLDLAMPNIPGINNYIDLVRRMHNKYDDRKVAIGFYRNESFFEHYHRLNINSIRKNL